MKYLSINPTMDYALTNQSYYIFFSSHLKKYIKFNATEILEYLINYFSYGNLYENFIEDNIFEVFEEKDIYLSLSFLIDKKIIIQKNVDQEFDYTKYKLPELKLDKRFGYQIAYLSERYNINFRHIMKKLSSFKIAIVGLGAIGSNVAVNLAAMGVGELRLIDGDIVEESNLTRQYFYTEKDINKEYKVNSLNRFIKSLNSGINIIAIPEYIVGKSSELNHFEGLDLIVQTADAPSGLIDRYINNHSITMKIPAIYVHNGTIGPMVIPGQTLDYEDFEEYLDLESYGLYTQSIENIQPKSRTAYPTISHGTLNLAYYLIDYILDFIFLENIDSLNNKIWVEDTKKYIDFTKKEGE